ncbi:MULTISPECIES: GIY-YIG nuclease family protein [unclassified Enterococcus]|uniref:GIY-YIG nuclease family protein n=1 Tax=unclassified Enterococcus TaxID=2608891 RepID=UPI00201B448C|nr:MULTISPECIES: GIY-YIG nuclease family protein [unclassified Enterococcus]
MENKAYFYVLKCADKSFYGGYTTEPNRRLKEHNQGTGAKYTRHRTPVQMIHLEAFETKSEAMKAEAAFKKLTRTAKCQYLKNTKSEQLP